MKHLSGIDYDHFLDDIRDMYPFSIDEAVLTELVANALDARTGLIDIRIDPEQKTFEITDTGEGMDKGGFEAYHNFSTSFKRKGQGIGFAGLGAKLALKIAERIVSETRSRESGRSRKPAFWGASEWKFPRSRKTPSPFWFDIEERQLAVPGTRVRIHLKSSHSLLLRPDVVRSMLLKHYRPLLAMPDFYEDFRLYKRITILVNGELLQPPGAQVQATARYTLRTGARSRPFARAVFELHGNPLPEEQQGIAIATFGKIITRTYLKQYFSLMHRVTGTIEAPELVDCLTTSKCDFRKDGSAGRKYYRLHRLAQLYFRRWLEELNLVDAPAPTRDKEAKQLEVVLNRIVEVLPDLQQFYGAMGQHSGLVRSEDGGLLGAARELALRAEQHNREEQPAALAREALEHASSSDTALVPGEEYPATRRLRTGRSGPSLRYVHAPGRADIGWMEGDTVLINTAHPTYAKASAKKVLEYHNLFAAAVAMLREVPTSGEKIELLERFMGEWGRL